MVTYPSEWDALTLGDLGQVKMCKRIFQSQTRPYGQIPFYKIGTFGGVADAYISRELFDEYKSLYSFPRRGDVMISAAGTIGRTVVYDGKDAYFQDSNIVWLDVNPKEVDRTFLKYYYQTYPWVNLEGTTISRLYNDIIRKTDIHLPPLPEQEEIAKTLLEFDTYIADLAELIEKKRGIRDSALEDLMSGKTRAECHAEEWSTATLKQLCYLITKQTGFDYSEVIKCSLVQAKTDEVIPFIQNKDFEGLNVNLRTDYYIPKSVAVKYPKILLDEKCLLISISGKLGNVGVYDKKELSFVGSAICIARLNDKRLAEWIMYYIQSPAGQKELLKSEKASSHRNLTIADIRNMNIPLPKDNERNAIVDTMKAMDEEIEALEIERDKMIQIREGAMNDLLTGHVRLSV